MKHSTNISTPAFNFEDEVFFLERGVWLFFGIASLIIVINLPRNCQAKERLEDKTVS
jgi:hypothetical protein